MAKNKSNKELEEKIDKIAKKAIEKATYEIGYKIESAYENVIQKFYDDYHERYYDRTFNTYKASNAIDDYEKTIKKAKDGYSIGVNISSKNMPEIPYKTRMIKVDGQEVLKREWVFTRTFEEGIHGTRNIKVMSKSPKALMDEWFDEFTRSEEIDDIVNTSIEWAIKH